MAPESQFVQSELNKLAYWDNGKNHIIFELSDAPCSPYDVGYAMVAKSGCVLNVLQTRPAF